MEKKSMPELRYDGRVAVVTGAGRGLGRSYAMLLAAKGAKVVVHDSDVERAGQSASSAAHVVEEIRTAGGEAIARTESFADLESDAGAIIEAALEHFGRIDILIHNAGPIAAADLSVMTTAEFDSVVSVHQGGAFQLVRRAFPVMRASGYGRIVLSSSFCGIYGCLRQANYATAKAGVIGLSNVVALEGAARNIKCNIILPTAAIRLGAGRDMSGYPMRSEAIAPAVAWLSHESCTMSGEMLVAAGGRIARAFLGETPGVYHPEWTVEEVGQQIEAICAQDDAVGFAVLPNGHNKHIDYSYEMGRRWAAR
jgi:NAD(P)-dependent dehydrogenase (short-subunit alcohol dehydrogenase family)